LLVYSAAIWRRAVGPALLSEYLEGEKTWR